MVDEELRARIISRAKVKVGKMEYLSILEAVTLLEYIEELESRPTQRGADLSKPSGSARDRQGVYNESLKNK